MPIGAPRASAWHLPSNDTPQQSSLAPPAFEPPKAGASRRCHPSALTPTECSDARSNAEAQARRRPRSAGDVPRAPQRAVAHRHDRRAVRRQAGDRVRAARRVHADLLVDPLAALQRAGAGVQAQGHRRDRLHRGQRPVRDGGLGARRGGRQPAAAARRQWRVHAWHGHAGRQERRRPRRALVALLDAREGPADREDVRRTPSSRAIRTKFPTPTRCCTTSTRTPNCPTRSRC